MRLPTVSVLAALALGLGAFPLPAGATPAAPVARTVHACAAPTPEHASCLAVADRRRQPAIGARTAAVAPPTDGYRPADIASIYHLDVSRGAGQTVAIVDAYDDPNAERDLAVYRSTWKLPACTTANGCFRKVNQRGGSTAPTADPGWATEISLDVDAVSAACPKCHILLVEADTDSYDDLGAAENRAVTAGAKIVSNSYGGLEFTGVLALAAKYYDHAGVATVVSTGDDGFGSNGFGGASFPAVAPRAIGAGGTTVVKSGSHWTQSAWAGSGSGCSAWFAKPAWQHDTHCSMRTSADLSALADPDTGLAIYDTYQLDEATGLPDGWAVFGGTSLAAPLISAMIGLAGNAPALANAHVLYGKSAGITDVVGGSNGYCGGDYLCTAVRGYDGPTGVGTPAGLGAL